MPGAERHSPGGAEHVQPTQSHRRTPLASPGYWLSQYSRKLIETVFGDTKQHGILRQVKLRRRRKVDLLFTLSATVGNLRRMPALMGLHPSGPTAGASDEQQKRKTRFPKSGSRSGTKSRSSAAGTIAKALSVAGNIRNSTNC
jgi:hypothetical protein